MIPSMLAVSMPISEDFDQTALIIKQIMFLMTATIQRYELEINEDMMMTAVFYLKSHCFLKL